jgi:uncharacterized protein HemX
MTRNAEGVLRFGPAEWVTIGAICAAQIGAGMGAYIALDQRVTRLEARQMTEAQETEIAQAIRRIDVLIEQVRVLTAQNSEIKQRLERALEK